LNFVRLKSLVKTTWLEANTAHRAIPPRYSALVLECQIGEYFS